MNKTTRNLETDIFDSQNWEELYKSDGQGILTKDPDPWIVSQLMDHVPYIKKNKVKHCVDLGMGDGRHLFRMKMEFGATIENVMGCDASQTAVGIVSQKISSQMLHNSVGSSYFDLNRKMERGTIPHAKDFGFGICTDTLSIVENPARVLENIRTGMNQKARLLITIQSAEDETFGQGNKVEEYSKEGRSTFEDGGIGFSFYTEAGVRKIIENTGWTIKNIESFTRTDPPHFQRPSYHDHHYHGLVLENS